ncbi:hypothetical protein CANMA_001047 [Candida margitis]|uniref:uncharacterized protein n=1 Tax=Candida margitis TaxID=1775924 RepID=UPI002225E88A|nr:uncharacterized protein CANMA_001047 [Candida margitis]KAI5969905.1 hypothetical protein CANMA_001047 [Candida margitis]
MSTQTIPSAPSSRSAEATLPEAVSFENEFSLQSKFGPIGSDFVERESDDDNRFTSTHVVRAKSIFATSPINREKDDNDNDNDDNDDDEEFYSLDPNQIEFDTSIFCNAIEKGRDIDPQSLDLSLGILAREHLEFVFAFEANLNQKEERSKKESLMFDSFHEDGELEVGPLPAVNFDLQDLVIETLNSRIQYLSVESESYNLLIEVQKREISDLKDKVTALGGNILAPILDELSSEDSE